jgi:transposase
MKTLLVAPKLLKLDRIISSPGHMTLFVHSTQNRVRCPRCQQLATRIHSRYERTLADLPWEGVAVQIKLQTRRFFCGNDDCRLKIFCERVPELAARYARKTTRLNETLRLLGLMVGGEVGARIAGELGLKVSPDTLLRRLRAAVLPEPQSPRVIPRWDVLAERCPTGFIVWCMNS